MTNDLRRAVSRILGHDCRREPIQIVVWGKPDCSLCDRVHVMLEKLSHDYSLAVTNRDITLDPVDFERFRYDIPVVEIAGTRRFAGRITEHWLRQQLDKATRR